MPTYDFQCSSCGHIFDHKMSMTDYSEGKRPKCPDCGDSKPVRKFGSSINVLTKHNGPNVTYEVPGVTPPSGGGCCGGGCGCN